jgi:hypothetical protein
MRRRRRREGERSSKDVEEKKVAIGGNRLRSAVALRPAKSRMFDRATRDIIRHRESSRFQVVVERQLQMTEEINLIE